MNIQHFNYQRNGVGGEPFYSLLSTTLPNVKQKSKYLITFRAVEDGIIIDSCRVVDINNPLHCWRGDEVAYALASLYAQSGFASIWEWKESLKS